MTTLPQNPPKVNHKCASCALNHGTQGAPSCAGGYRPDCRGWCGGWRAVEEPMSAEERERRFKAAMERWMTHRQRMAELRSHHSRGRSHRTQAARNARRNP